MISVLISSFCGHTDKTCMVAPVVASAPAKNDKRALEARKEGSASTTTAGDYRA